MDGWETRKRPPGAGFRSNTVGVGPSERISVPNLGLEWFADKINGICRNNTFTNASYAMVAAPIVAQAAILDGESDQRGHNFKFGTFLG